MTREQAELIIKEEGLIETEWNKYGEAGGEYYFIIWFNPNNNKYETIYIGERGGVEDEYAFDNELLAEKTYVWRHQRIFNKRTCFTSHQR